MNKPSIRFTVLTACLLNIGACMVGTHIPLLENKQALAHSSTDTSSGLVSCDETDSIPNDQESMADKIY